MIDEKARKRLLEEAKEFSSVSRRSFLAAAGAGSAALAAGSMLNPLEASEIQVAEAGKKVRVGIPLTYGPFNQPWRRGCWQLVKTVLEMGGEPVTVRGKPTKASEQEAERTLMDRDIDVLCMGIYSLESETAYIADEAKERGIPTVGFAVPVKDSPAVVEDTWATAMTLGYFVQNDLQRQGTLVQTAEDKGFYTPFDMEADMLDLMTKYEPRMNMLPFMPGSVSTQDQISKGRENMLSLLQANPEPGSVSGLISWWWPLTIGAGQGMRQMGRTDVTLYNHYFSDQLLQAMAAEAYPIIFSTDVPWHTLGQKTAELAMALGRGEDVPNYVYQVPVTAIVQPEAAAALAEVQEMDKQAIALLKEYGG
ncbi:MAG: substrate-binding domain-containing protein [Pseudomonadota bacterium]